MAYTDGLFSPISYERFLIEYNSSLGQANKAEFLDDEDVKLVHLVFSIVTLSFIPFIFVHNMLVFWGTLLYPGFNTPNNILLFSLCIADFFMGAWCIPMYILAYLSSTKEYIYSHKYLCLAWFASIEVSGGGSLTNLMAIAFDRYIAVMWPLRYRSIMTPSRAYKVVFCIWTYILIMSFVPMMGWNNYNSEIKEGYRRCNFYITLPKNYVMWAAFFTVYSSISIPAILYAQIIFVVCRQVRRFRRESHNWPEEQRRQFEQRLSSVQITSALMFMFIMLWLPYILIAPFKYSGLFSQKSIEITKVIAQILYFGNSMVNAPIYAIGKKEYRIVYIQMLTTAPWNWNEELRELYAIESMRTAQGYSVKTRTSYAPRGALEKVEKEDAHESPPPLPTPSPRLPEPSEASAQSERQTVSSYINGSESVNGKTNLTVYEFLGTNV